MPITSVYQANDEIRMPDPTIRRARIEDADILADLGRRTFVESLGHLYRPHDLAEFLATAYSPEATLRDLTAPDRAAWLVERDGEQIGLALAGTCSLPHPEVTPACGELKRIYLLRDHQNGGLGARLFGDVLAWLERDGPRTLWIGVWSGNLGAQRFYARAGFELAGEYGFQVGSVVDREFIMRRRE